MEERERERAPPPRREYVSKTTNFGRIPKLVEDENEVLFCDPQAVARSELMISNHELQQFTNEIRREEIATGRKIL
jgi:hypothetical protein